MSDLLNKASLVMVPSGYKEDTVYSVVPSDGSGDLSFTRASNGTRVNSAGLVEVCPWNLLLNTNTFSSWDLEGGTLTSGFTAPDSTSTAYKYVQVPGGGLYSGSASATSGVKTASVWLKSVSGTSITCIIGDGDASNTTVVSVTGDWQLFTATYTTSTSRPSVYIYGISNASGIYVWHPQLNIGSTAKPYFPTTDRLNVPRLTYQNGGGGCPSLLLEKQSTNLALESNTLSTNPNVPAQSTATANVYVSPDGTQNAMQFTEQTVNDIHGFYQYNTVSAQTYTASVWTKQTGRRYISFYSDFTGSATASFFDLQTISVVSSGSGHTCSIQDFGNGWFRLIVTLTATAGSRFVFWGGSNNGSSVSYAGSTSISQTFYGYQLEASSYPTSYIPTTSSSATRVADACFKTGISSLIGQTEGTIFLDFVATTEQAFFTISNSASASSNNIYIQTALNDVWKAYVVVGGTYQVIITAGTGPSGRCKMAFAYKQNDFVLYADGVLVQADTSGTVPTCDNLNFGYINNTYQPFQTNQAILFPTRLTNAELASLTTI